MARRLHPHSLLGVTLGLLPVLAIGSVVIAHQRQGGFRSSTTAGSSQLKQAETGTSTSTEVEPVDDTALSLQSIVAEPDLPQSAQAVLANFYAAYADRDADRLSIAFSPDLPGEEAAAHDRLFGSSQSEPGLLFAHPSASRSVASYTVLSSTERAGTYTISIRERLREASGSEAGERTALLSLLPAGEEQGGWQVGSYVAAGGTGKYSGFLIQ